MSTSPKVTAILKSSPYLARMSFSLFWTYLTLERRVQKTRKAFEEELVSQGMSREDAKRLSTCYEDLKNSITRVLRQGVAHSLR
jgi:hypothetical protein